MKYRTTRPFCYCDKLVTKCFSHVLNHLMTDLSKAFAGTSKLEKILDIWNAGKLFYTLSTWGLALAG